MTNSSQSRKPQLFINFRGKGLRKTLISFLKPKLDEIGDINVFMDECEIKGSPLSILFERIRESSFALVIFSKEYPESSWCLDELVEIKKQMDTGSLVPFPIFYKVKPDSVKTQSGNFHNTLLKTEDYVRKKIDQSCSKSILATEARIWGWRQALASVCERMGSPHEHKGDEDFVREIVDKVKEMIHQNSSPRNDLSLIERPPQEIVTSLLQALNLKKSDLEDLITMPSIHINGFVPLGTDRLVFLDLISLQNSILPQRLSKPGQAERILMVLLGSLDYNTGFAFKPLTLTRKPQKLPDMVATRCQIGESNDNIREDNNSDADLTCFSFLCNILERCAMIVCPPSQRVFVSFGEKLLGKTLVSFLKKDLESNRISVYGDDEMKGRIKESTVAIVVFSTKLDSKQFLDELVEIKNLRAAGMIDPFPVFYNLKAESVIKMSGCFGNRLLKIEKEVRKNVDWGNERSILGTEARISGWRQALFSIASRPGLSYHHSSDAVFVTDVVTKVKELCTFKGRKKNPISNINIDLVEEKPLPHKHGIEVATTADKSLDDDLLYSPTSFLQALNLEITDLEGFTEIPNGIVSLSLKGRNTNLVFLKLSSEHLVPFQRSDSFKFLTMGFALNPSSTIRLGGPSQTLALESYQSEQWYDMPTPLNNQYASSIHI